MEHQIRTLVFILYNRILVDNREIIRFRIGKIDQFRSIGTVFPIFLIRNRHSHYQKLVKRRIQFFQLQQTEISGIDKKYLSLCSVSLAFSHNPQRNRDTCRIKQLPWKFLSPFTKPSHFFYLWISHFFLLYQVASATASPSYN